MTDAATTTAATTTTTAAATSPWYEGKADAEVIGHWDNKGWKKDDPGFIAIEATKAARAAQGFVGLPPERLIKLPEKADDEASWKGVYSRLGVPAEPKEYDFGSIKYADGSDVEQGFTDMMRASLHKAAVRKEAAPQVVKDVLKWLGDADAAEAAERKVKTDTAKADLARLWGTNADLNRLHAIQGAKRLGIDLATANFFEEQIGHVAIMEALRKIGKGTTEDTFVEGTKTGPDGGMPTTVDGAKARKAELMADSAWVERYLRNGAAEVREMAALNNIIAASLPAAA